MISLPDFIKDSERSQKMERNQPVNMIHATDSEILNHFQILISMHYRPQFAMNEQFYGGITKDVKTNLSRHHIDSYLGCVEVDSYNTAERIERLLYKKFGVFIGARGYASAGNGGKDDSTIVYLADRKINGFQD